LKLRQVDEADWKFSGEFYKERVISESFARFIRSQYFKSAKNLGQLFDPSF